MADPFTSIISIYGPRLAHEFGLTAVQNAGFWGNLAWESGQFRFFKEVGSGANSGGRGMAQWTGSRRIAFLGYCKAHRMDPTSADASYAFLCVELHGTYAYVIAGLKRCVTVESATTFVETKYEAAGIRALGGRIALARRALAILSPGHPGTVAPVAKRSARAPMAKKATHRHRRHA